VLRGEREEVVMAQIIKNNGENSMAEEESDQRAEDARQEKDHRDDREEKETIEYRAPGTPGPGAGKFFHIYKSGQGYWTRMGTAGGAALVILLVGQFLYTWLPTWFDTLHTNSKLLIGIVFAVVAAMALLAFYITNRPGNVDFLIATDSEMKKVNWTSREELIGSTKIVIIFVFLITALLFGIDIIFGYVFHWIGILKQAPF
jgi:preprotein translocase SecE subunit